MRGVMLFLSPTDAKTERNDEMNHKEGYDSGSSIDLVDGT